MLRQFRLGRGLPAAVADPVPPRPAATVMLLKDSAASGGVDVFVFRRVASMDFAAGMHVFPGGRVDERDDDTRLPWSGPVPETFADQLSADPGLARVLVVAAVRETFEECGILLAARPDGRPVDGLGGGPWSDAWTERHRRLVAGEAPLAEILLEAGLVLRADWLHPWAHWITPVSERRRYDTRFFVAAVPAGQEARDLGGEGELAEWLNAADGVRRSVAGQARLMPPTLVCMEELAAAPSVAAVLGTERRVRPVTPWVAAPPDEGLLLVDLDGLGGGQARP